MKNQRKNTWKIREKNICKLPPEGPKAQDWTFKVQLRVMANVLKNTFKKG